MDNCGIYRIINLINGNCYVGSSINLKNRGREHFKLLKGDYHPNKHLQYSFNNYGKKEFIFEIIKIIEKYDDSKKLKEELLKWEQYYINEFIVGGDIDHTKCYNNSPTARNSLGTKCTLSQKLEMSKITKARMTDEIKNYLRELNLGNRHTEESIEKIRETSRLRWKDNNYKNKTSKKISESLKGKKKSEEHIKNIKKFHEHRKGIIVTDGCTGYNILRTTNHVHFKIDHNKLYAEGDTHTNNIESFWDTLKRGILGIYHKVSVKYLQDYVNEFCFRYNNRSVNMFDLVLTQSIIS